jgi:hypothetical protein
MGGILSRSLHPLSRRKGMFEHIHSRRLSCWILLLGRSAAGPLQRRILLSGRDCDGQSALSSGNVLR